MAGTRIVVLDESGFDHLSSTWRRTDERDLSTPRYPWQEQVHPLGVPNPDIMVKITGAKESDGTSHEGLYPGVQVFRSGTHDPSVTVGTGTPKNPPKWVDGNQVWVCEINDGDLEYDAVTPVRYFGKTVGFYDGKYLVVVGVGSGGGGGGSTGYVEGTLDTDLVGNTASATFNVYEWDGAAWSDTGDNLTVYCNFTAAGETIPTGTWVGVLNTSGRNMVVMRRCASGVPG